MPCVDLREMVKDFAASRSVAQGCVTLLANVLMLRQKIGSGRQKLLSPPLYETAIPNFIKRKEVLELSARPIGNK